MAFNGAGVFQRLYNWVTDAANSINITDTRMDAEMDGFATGLSNCMTRDGQSPPTANIPMGGYKLTGLAAGTTAGDAVRYEQLTSPTFTGLVNFAAGADIASAATIDLTAATGNCPRITGTTATSAVTMNTGEQVLVVADGAWPLTYHATTNKLSTGVSYTCTAGDVVLYYKDLSGVVHGQIISGSTTFISALLSKISVTRGEILYHNGTSWVSLATGTAGAALKTQGAGANPIWEFPSFEGKLFRCKDEKTAGTDGGTFTSGAWQQRDLNVLETNEISGASLASSQITLPAGTYYIDASAPAHVLDVHQTLLYNATDASNIIIGTSEKCNAANVSTSRSYVKGRFTLTGTKALELRHRVGTTRDIDGLGKACNFGVTEIYAEVSIWKIS